MADSVKDSIDIEARADELFQAAIDFESYPSWADGVKKVEVKERDDEGRPLKVWWQVDAKVKTITYTLQYDYSSAPESFSWKLVEGDLNSLEGSYTFDEFGDTTDVTYEMTADLGFPVPGFIKRQGEKQIVRTALEGLKKRVASQG
ncbi:MAG TPA: SRPBCC family protein [Actinomycetota bacterium]|nr:SRPBCC family protein [Actinomycetota bacterium]